MVISVEEVKTRYPIHWLVWNNQHEELKKLLSDKRFTEEDLELKDPRGRTPLLLAVTLSNIESVKVLLDAGADVNCEKDGWTAVQEATCNGDAELLSLVVGHRDMMRHVLRAAGIPDLLTRLSMAPDFYVEMKWEFISWMPLVSRMCPSDTYKVYKRGANVRVDTTLIGFENNRWQRGNRTYIFRGKGAEATLTELDHELRTAWREGLRAAPPAPPRAPPPRALRRRLAAPAALNYLDTDKISFERNKSGIWGWRQDKTEAVNGYECKVFSANNVELVSVTRTEHLKTSEKKLSPRAPLAGLLMLADSEPEYSEPGAADLLTPEKEEPPQTSRRKSSEDLRPPISWEEYFSGEDMDRDIGKTKEVNTKVQKFKANLWLCEDYPLELQEQIMPILDLMASMSSPHFAKLKDFIQMQLPAGFPVKIEIPLFHVLNARITFGNIFGTEAPVAHVASISEGARLACVLDDACFEAGAGYRDVAAASRPAQEHEEALLQYAVQQSLLEGGSQEDQVDVWEALRGARPATPRSPRASPLPDLRDEDTNLQRAIEASLMNVSLENRIARSEEQPAPSLDEDPELAAALEASTREQALLEQMLREEERALEEAMRLSLMEK